MIPSARLLRLLAFLPLLLAAVPARAEGILSAEAGGTLFFRADPRGSAFDLEPALALRLGLGLEEAFGLPEALLFDVGAHWYGARSVEGPLAVQVGRWTHTFALPVRLGWELAWRPWDALSLAPHLAAGPAITHTAVTYRVADPVAVRQGWGSSESSASDWKAGALYGVGLSVRAPLGGPTLTTRLEVLRLHRGPAADLGLGLGAGLLF